MAEIRWTAEAERWLDDIFHYIASDSQDAAYRTVVGIYDIVQKLARFPEMGYVYFVPGRRVRILLHGHYRIAYLIKDSEDIDILGVFHGAMEIDRYLR